MTIVTLDPAGDPRWRTLLDSYHSDLFHSPAWLAVLVDTYGFTPQALILVDSEGTPVAGLPFCEIEDIFGARRVCLPFSDFCDPLVSSPSQWAALAAPLLEGDMPVTVRCLHDETAQDDGRFTPAKTARWHGLTLPADEETLWQSIHGSARRAIRKAQKAGVIVRPASQAELRRFFELHVGVRKYKYRLIAQPYRFFESIWQRFVAPGNGRLFVAEYEAGIIGAVLFLDWQGGLYYKFNASHPDYLGLRPNDLIMWTGLQYALQNRYRYVDFGLSDDDQPGLIRYKRKFANCEKTIRFLARRPSVPADPHAADLRARFNRLTDLLTDPSVPNAITAQAGDILYRYFT